MVWYSIAQYSTVPGSRGRGTLGAPAEAPRRGVEGGGRERCMEGREGEGRGGEG